MACLKRLKWHFRFAQILVFEPVEGPSVHIAVVIELPVFAIARALQVAVIVAPIIGKPHRDTATVEDPHFLYQSVFDFTPPLAFDEGLH
jgi:hypothetical protein